MQLDPCGGENAGMNAGGENVWPGEVEKLVDQRIISGLPAEVHLQTRERTILSYFLKPITDQISRTFRER